MIGSIKININFNININIKIITSRLGQHYQMAAVISQESGVLRFKQTIKLHYVCGHLHEQAKLVNPRYVHTYGSEGLVGKICNIYKQSQSGPWEPNIQHKLLLKYRAGRAIDMQL